MKIFRRILLIILCIALIVISVGFFLPRKIHVERSLLMSSSQKTLFSQVNTLKNWAKWSPWLHIDTAMKLTSSGPESGVGAKITWLSSNKDVGNGSVSIVSSILPDSVEIVFDFAEKGKSTGKFFFLKKNQNTKVTFYLESDLGLNPLSRWFGLFSEQLIGPDIEMGLINLNQFVQNTKSIYGYEITDYELPGRILITVRDTASPGTVTPKLALMYKKISLFLKIKNISPIGNPLTLFHNYSTQNFDIEAGLAIPIVIAVPEGLNCTEKQAQRAVMIKYTGYYKMIASAYVAIQNYIDNNELLVIGPGWEEYVTNPVIEADSSKRQTNICYPIQ